jgi:hypothetical protein
VRGVLTSEVENLTLVKFDILGLPGQWRDHKHPAGEKKD